MFGAWGLLPFAVSLLAFVVWRLTLLVFRDSHSRSDRAAGAVVLAMAVVHATVGTLAQFSLLSPASILTVLAFAGAVLFALTDGAPSTRLPRAALPMLGITLILGLAIISARLIPIWQWDSLGYHLPFAQFVLQSGGFSEVPGDVRYISTYPHNIELAMIWLRAMLPDDRLVDLVQVPYGLGGAVLIASLARKLGASELISLCASVAWLAAPGVFLQLPTNYVDIGTATTLLGALYFLFFAAPEAARRNLVIGGISLGLFLGCKPSAPMAAALIGAVVFIRAAHAKQWRALALFTLCTFVFGAEMYVTMLVHHGNPVWPVQVHLGPITLPGEQSVDTLLATASAVPRANGSWLERLTLSWLAVDTHPVFDMRLGGFGWLFLLALPAALLALIRKRSGWLVVAVALSLVSPDPSTTRYVLAFAALIFALAASVLSSVPRLTMATVMLVGAMQITTAWPSLVGDGPAWSELWAMSDDERRMAVGPNGRPTDYPEAWSQVGPNESVAFDVDFEFPALLWSPELRYPVHFLPLVADLPAWLEHRHVRVAAVGALHAAMFEASPNEWRKLFDCSSSDCAVYVRR